MVDRVQPGFSGVFSHLFLLSSSRSPDCSCSSSSSSPPSCHAGLVLPSSSSHLLWRSGWRSQRLAELHPGLQQGQTEESCSSPRHVTPPPAATRLPPGNRHHGDAGRPAGTAARDGTGPPRRSLRCEKESLTKKFQVTLFTFYCYFCFLLLLTF